MTTPAATPSKGSSSSAENPRIGGGTDGDREVQTPSYCQDP